MIERSKQILMRNGATSVVYHSGHSCYGLAYDKKELEGVTRKYTIDIDTTILIHCQYLPFKAFFNPICERKKSRLYCPGRCHWAANAYLLRAALCSPNTKTELSKTVLGQD